MPSKQVEDVYNAGGFRGGPLDPTATERKRRQRAREKAGLVAVTVEVPKTDVRALEAFAEKLRKIAAKHAKA